MVKTKKNKPQYPQHQRCRWQADESRGWVEQKSYSYWNLVSSKSQTTCKDGDGPLSSANSYISNNSASPSVQSQTSRHTDTLWLCLFFSFLFLFFYPLGNFWVSCISSVHPSYVEASALFQGRPRIQQIELDRNNLPIMQNAYFHSVVLQL